jgi:hypothetical protein
MTIRAHSFGHAKSIRKKAFLDGDSVPMPLGFTAFPPEWLVSLGRLAPPRYSGRWVGAPVASLRCRTLRPGEVSINRAALTKNIRDQKSLLEGLKVG